MGASKTGIGLFIIFLSLWVLLDAPRRGMPKWWALLVLFFPIVSPIYVYKSRPEGGNKEVGILAFSFIGALFLGGFLDGMISGGDNKTSKPTIESEWIRFSPQNHNFSSLFPYFPKKEESSFGGEGEGVLLTKYVSETQEDIFYISTFQLSDNDLSKGKPSQILERMVSDIKVGFGDAVVKHLVLQKQDQPTHELVIKTEDAYLHSRLKLAGNRFYEVSVISKKYLSDDQDRRKFLDSFIIVR